MKESAKTLLLRAVRVGDEHNPPSAPSSAEDLPPIRLLIRHFDHCSMQPLSSLSIVQLVVLGRKEGRLERALRRDLSYGHETIVASCNQEDAVAYRRLASEPYRGPNEWQPSECSAQGDQIW